MEHFDGARLPPNSVRNVIWHALNELVCQYLRMRNPRCSTVYIDNSLGPLVSIYIYIYIYVSLECDKKIKLTNGIWHFAKFKSMLHAGDVDPAWIEGWLQVVAHQLNIFVRKYKMKVCSNRTTSNGNGWQQQQKQKSKIAMSSGCCGCCCLTDGSFLIVYTVWCAWFVLTFWRTYCLHLQGDLISFRWLFIWFGGRKCVGYVWWFEGNVANLGCGREKRE